MDTPTPILPGSEFPAEAPRPTTTPPARPSRRRRFLKRGAAAVGVVALGAAVFGAGAVVDRTGLLGGPAAQGTPEEADDFGLIREAWDQLHEKYVDASELDSRELAYQAIEGLVEAVGDTGHTSFMTPEEREANRESLSGSYVGIGVELDIRDGYPVVGGVVRNGPADEGGVEVGDRILSVDGTPTAGADLDKVASLVRGEEGDEVTLELGRVGTEGSITVTLVRAEIDLPAVSWSEIPGTDLVMLRIEQFGTGSADEAKAALDEVLATDPAGLVLDLRGNPGGYVNEGIATASEFLPEGTEIHLSRDATDTFTPTMAEPDGLALDIPVIVLVDEGTASSSEIVTGALQDNDRATVVGRRTFGTGTVLSEVPLSDGSALRIGVIEWLTPAGREIWHQGIAPDHSVTLPTGIEPLAPEDLETLTPAELDASGDAQLLKAIDLLEADT
jgi:carboxyl-terminal processing protease